MKITVVIEDVDQETLQFLLERLKNGNGNLATELTPLGDPYIRDLYPNHPAECQKYSDAVTGRVFEICEFHNGRGVEVRGKDRTGRTRAKAVAVKDDRSWEISLHSRLHGKRRKLSTTEAQKVASQLDATFDGEKIRGRGKLTPDLAVRIWKACIR